jgi:hypothetical protein
MSKTDLPLLADEKIVIELRPHPLAFWQSQMVYVIFVVLSIVLWQMNSVLSGLLVPKDLHMLSQFNDSILQPLVGSQIHGQIAAVLARPRDITFLIMWWYLIVFFGCVVSFLTINFVSILGFVAIGLISTGFFFVANVPFLLVCSILCFLLLVLIELKRRSHRYVLTNFRLITQTNFLVRKQREILLSRVTETVRQQDLIGRMFNFGTVLPIAESGLGMGSDFAVMGAGIGIGKGGLAVAGGKSVNVARSLSEFELFNVPALLAVDRQFQQLLLDNDQVANLKQIGSQIDDLARK